MADEPTANLPFFDDCCYAFLAGKYVEAAVILEKGLKANKERVQSIGCAEVLEQFLARLILLKGEQETAPPPPEIKLRTWIGRIDALKCSFCGKGQNEVQNLIAGPKVYICNECVGICNEIIEDDKAARAASN